MIRSVRVRALLAASAATGLALAAAVAPAAPFPGVPRVAERILSRDWCKPSSYRLAREAAARAHVRLSQSASANLLQSERTARAHPAGCRFAEALVPRHADRLGDRAPWLKVGRRGVPCPRDPLPLEPGWRSQAARAALAYEMRSERPILIDTVRAAAPAANRGPQVIRACGTAAAQRTVEVDLALTAFYPSASLSERSWAVADFSRWGWRPWLLLH
jgi:hypothetical protein